MKALNVFLTAIIYLVGLFFFTPLCMSFGLPDGESNTALTLIGATTSTVSGYFLTKICATKFYQWFNSHIK